MTKLGLPNGGLFFGSKTLIEKGEEASIQKKVLNFVRTDNCKLDSTILKPIVGNFRQILGYYLRFIF
jgi:hypothetical protein